MDSKGEKLSCFKINLTSLIELRCNCKNQQKGPLYINEKENKQIK
ncbi:unnamed protein product [Paramecium sonneborni]|uniref:Uncharacterized protein n=1 Tax=Paramecium sonneborni TaxID=65129 RepID=A0A8S1MV59_9CILI|nr:unnamed protein product [Paramecium sonneborni]